LANPPCPECISNKPLSPGYLTGFNLGNVLDYTTKDYFHLKSFVDTIKSKGIKAVVAIGGWSDTCNTPTTSTEITSLVTSIKTLYSQIQCDGFDFDWEHLSTDYTDCTPEGECLSTQKQDQTNATPSERNLRLKGLYSIILQLKTYFKGKNVEISYTTRFNGYKSYGTAPSNSEAKDLLNSNVPITLDKMPCDYINIMSYDQRCVSSFSHKCTSGDDSFSLAVWQDIMDSYKNVSSNSDIQKYLKENTNIGFEPNPQAALGKNSSKEVLEKTMDLINQGQYGGILVWAINDGGQMPLASGKITCNLDKDVESINILQYFMTGKKLQETKTSAPGNCPPIAPVCCVSDITRADCAGSGGTTTLGKCSNIKGKSCYTNSVKTDCA